MKSRTIFEVPCGGSTHRTLVTPKGAIVLLDHGGFRPESALAGLGQTRLPACFEVRCLFADLPTRYPPSVWSPPRIDEFDWWRVGGAVSEEIRVPIYEAACRRHARRVPQSRSLWRQPAKTCTDYLTLPLRERWQRRFVDEATSALFDCTYRYPFRSGGDLIPNVTFRWGCPSAKLRGELTGEALLSSDGYSCRVHVEIGPAWAQVLRRGLAVIDHKLVLEIIEDSGPLIVRAGRQYRDFSIRPCLARVTRSGRLRWLS
jgi:hypothetical protein